MTRFLSGVRREGGLSVVLVFQAAIIFVIGPLGATGSIAPAVFELFRFGLAAAAVILLSENRYAALLIVVTFALTVLLPLSSGSTSVSLLQLAATSAFDIAVAATVARVAFSSGGISVHRIMGGIVLYLSVALLFGNAYRVCSLLFVPSFHGLSPDAHANATDLLYFSLTTLTTTGYGDIAPLHPIARSLANLEAVIGQLYPATFLARLVTLHTNKSGSA